MLAAGTRLFGCVTPGKGGADLHGLPVFDSVREAVDQLQVDASVVFVPASQVLRAVTAALEGGIRLVIVIAEHVPVHDALEIREASHEAGAVVVGPNTPGIISPGIGKLGIMPSSAFSAGRVGMLSRSGTLAYEVASILQAAGIGISTMVGVGGDPVVGVDMAELIPYFSADPETDAVVVVGEVGGSQEERVAEALRECGLPGCAYLAGRTAPLGRRVGHAGAFMTSAQGSVVRKTEVLVSCGIPVAGTPRQVAALVRQALG